MFSRFNLKIISLLFIEFWKTYNLVSAPSFLSATAPLAEQHRIVAKVDVLMALCDALESHLKERAGVQGRWRREDSKKRALCIRRFQ
jgi:hypothetical protein